MVLIMGVDASLNESLVFFLQFYPAGTETSSCAQRTIDTEKGRSVGKIRKSVYTWENKVSFSSSHSKDKRDTAEDN